MTKDQPLLRLCAKLQAFFHKPFFSNPRTLFGLWTLLAVVAGLTKMAPHRHNNFLIFRGVFWHTIQKLSLYDFYPTEYNDHNHYGPIFSLVIAPFAVVPDAIGLLLWLVVLALGMYYAVRRLPLEEGRQIFLYWFCAHELLTALQMQQFNIAIAAIIIGSFAAIEKGKEVTAAFLIVLGTFVKLYGVVGLAFFFFVKRKPRFILALIGWSVVCFVAPMLISSPEYVIGQYVEWYERLAAKNGENTFSLMQNISLLGMIRKASGSASYSDLLVILPGLALFGLPYLRFGQYRHLAFRYAILSSVLLFVVLFSTGSESSTYIIPFAGITLWYTTSPWKRSGWDVALLVFAFVLSSLSPSDLFPRSLREAYVLPYALKALPPTLIWLRLSYELLTRDYAPSKTAL
ncbi:PF09594 family protein [Porphyromonas sp. oral taxon 279 str. F0450]|uniref:glycosyltransferase family 87 protein n=1 Tax=Porphyromonas sp. oral taxon 279 TaxID=712438 RepID=UPI00027C61C3|nr:glycosyltransferase family 87 protein [Porphyromonas sp. oral taxon 279]EJU16833.1 PF09594 family protein [Porphyromonas sp. oral taxon 279 str. F0450]